MQLDEFLAQNVASDFPASAWTEFEDGTVYARRNDPVALGNGETAKCVTLANLDRDGRKVAHDPDAESSGFMDRLMLRLELFAVGEGQRVKVENVMNEFLPDWLVRRGYVEIDPEWPMSYLRTFPSFEASMGFSCMLEQVAQDESDFAKLKSDLGVGKRMPLQHVVSAATTYLSQWDRKTADLEGSDLDLEVMNVCNQYDLSDADVRDLARRFAAVSGPAGK